MLSFNRFKENFFFILRNREQEIFKILFYEIFSTKNKRKVFMLLERGKE
jgi:hypothetical protein